MSNHGEVATIQDEPQVFAASTHGLNPPTGEPGSKVNRPRLMTTNGTGMQDVD
jgi:hypothetical protein